MTALFAAHVALSLASFVMYGLDKSAAASRRRRIPEIALHLVSLAGGWPGALLGQRAFRHKTRKARFQVVFWCTVVLNGAAVAWLMSRQGGPM